MKTLITVALLLILALAVGAPVFSSGDDGLRFEWQGGAVTGVQARQDAETERLRIVEDAATERARIQEQGRSQRQAQAQETFRTALWSLPLVLLSFALLVLAAAAWKRAMLPVDPTPPAWVLVTAARLLAEREGREVEVVDGEWAVVDHEERAVWPLGPRTPSTQTVRTGRLKSQSGERSKVRAWAGKASKVRNALAALVMCRRSKSARSAQLSTAITKAAVFEESCMRSSPRVTSRRQWLRFSIFQCACSESIN